MFFTHSFMDVLAHEGVVSITTWNTEKPHVSNTWNSFVTVAEEDRILIPAAWMHITEKNIKQNPRVIVTLGSPDVPGKVGMGTGFVIEGTARFIESGKDYDMMKEKISFLTRVLEITISSVKQTL